MGGAVKYVIKLSLLLNRTLSIDVHRKGKLLSKKLLLNVKLSKLQGSEQSSGSVTSA